MWKDLICVLQKILVVYEELFALSEKKGLALRTVDIKDFETIVNREQLLITKINKLEEERQKTLQYIMQTKKITVNKMLDAIQFCEEATGDELKRIHQCLTTLLVKFEKNNKENERLIRQSLTLMNYKINILAETSVGPTYANFGQENVSATKWLDFKA